MTFKIRITNNNLSSFNITALGKKKEKLGFYQKNRASNEDYLFLNFFKTKELLVKGAKVTKKVNNILQQTGILPSKKNI